MLRGGVLIFFLWTLTALAGEKPKGFVADNDIFGTRVFIENKGQFISPVNGKEVLFLYDHGGEKIYFTHTGLIYEVRDRTALNSDEERAREEEERGLRKPK